MYQIKTCNLSAKHSAHSKHKSMIAFNFEFWLSPEENDTTAELQGHRAEPHTHIGKKRKPMNLFSHGYFG